MFKKLGFIILIIFGFSYYCFAANLKLGYVDFQKALNSVSEGVKAKESLTSEYQKKKTELESKQQVLAKLKAELESQTSILSEDAKKKKENELREKMTDFQQLAMKYEKDMQTQEWEYTKNILESLKTIVEKIGKDEKYTFILEKNEASIIFAEKSLDLTDRVIGIYEKSKKK